MAVVPVCREVYECLESPGFGMTKWQRYHDRQDRGNFANYLLQRPYLILHITGGSGSGLDRELDVISPFISWTAPARVGSLLATPRVSFCRHSLFGHAAQEHAPCSIVRHATPNASEASGSKRHCGIGLGTDRRATITPRRLRPEASGEERRPHVSCLFTNNMTA